MPCRVGKRIIRSFNTFFIVFFFQAEDGIRDGTVTGVQTCALPISGARKLRFAPARLEECRGDGQAVAPGEREAQLARARERRRVERGITARFGHAARFEIGRASCRERGWMCVGDARVRKTRAWRE